VCAGVPSTRGDLGAPIKDQLAGCSDDGKRYELDPEQPFRLIGDRKQDRDEQDGDEQ
jgi:hypothetical protein